MWEQPITIMHHLPRWKYVKDKERSCSWGGQWCLLLTLMSHSDQQRCQSFLPTTSFDVFDCNTLPGLRRIKRITHTFSRRGSLCGGLHLIEEKSLVVLRVMEANMQMWQWAHRGLMRIWRSRMFLLCPNSHGYLSHLHFREMTERIQSKSCSWTGKNEKNKK